MGMPPEEIEGRLMAQRKVLGLLAARLAKAGGGEDLLAQLDSFSELEVYEEDPGVIPNEGFAIESARADELRLIAEESRRRMDDGKE